MTSVMRTVVRSLLVSAAAIAAAGMLASCSEATVATDTRGVVSATVAITPVFDASVGEAAKAFRAAGLAYDNVRILIIRLPSDTLADVTKDFSPEQSDLQVSLTVNAKSTDEL